MLMEQPTPETIKTPCKAKTTRLRSVLIGLIVCIVLLIGAELLSWVLLTTQFSASERATIAVGEVDANATVYAHEATPENNRPTALQPYTGYVLNPRQKHPDTGHPGWMTVNELGFLGEMPKKQLADTEVAIVILGGSVAAELFLRARPHLVKLLSQYPRFQGKTIQVYSLALPGYKQPQQLMALNYVLALGYRFDIVINLDGVNEVAVGTVDNRPLNISPSYPRLWDTYAASAIGPQRLQLEAQRSLIKSRLRQVKTTLEASWLQYSHLAQVTGLIYERYQLKQLKALSAQLLHPPITTERLQPYQVTGPVFPPAPDETQALAESVRLWEQSSKQIWKLVNGLGMEYYHFLQPSQHVENSKRILSAAETALLTQPADYSLYQPAIEQGYPLLIETGSQMSNGNLPFMNLTQLFKYQQQSTYADNCCHYTLLGYERVAEKMAKTIGR